MEENTQNTKIEPSLIDTKVWFRAKRFGWGWQPCSWEGWLATLLCVALLVRDAMAFDRIDMPTTGDFVGLIISLAGITTLLILVCYARGEKPRWRWGK